MTWRTRRVPGELVERYVRDGYWTDETLGEFLSARLLERPDLEFRIHSRTRPYEGTVGDVYELGRRLAGGLAERGIGAGDVVAFQLPNWVEAGAAFYGLGLLGVVLVPIVHIYGRKEVAYILRQSGARALVTTDRFGSLDYGSWIPEVADELPELELTVVVGEPWAGAVAFDEVVSAVPVEGPVHVDPMSAAAIAYTSGTTSNPKGVIHAHRTLLAEIRQLTEMQADRPMGPGQGEDVPVGSLVGAPVGHVIGMLSGLLIPPHRGTPVNLVDVWDPGEVLRIMREHRLTAGSGATYFLLSLLDHPDCTDEHRRLMRHTGLGGAPVPAAVGERAEREGISIVRSYGSTEHPSTTGANHEAPREKRLFTDGRALPGVELKLVDLDGDEVGPGEPGEIWSRGPDLSLGYTDPELTAESFDDEGWYRTGDIAVMDVDGYVTITDRVKDIIIRGGENVSAVEVEEIVAGVPGVAEVAVVAAPDERYGEHGCAFVRLQPGAGPLTLEDLRAHLAQAGIAKQKWPEEVRTVDEFPRTASGKLQKFVLRQLLRAEAESASGG